MTWIIIVSILSAPSALATTGKKSFDLNVPTGWQEMKGFYGVPFTFLGPKTANGVRQTIQVIPTEQKKFLLDEARLRKFDQKNKSAKERWLAKSNGYLLSYKPAQKRQLGKLEVFVSEATYKYGDQGFDSKTYFTFCEDKLLQIKSLTSMAKDSGMKENDKVIESFRCKN